MECNTNAWMDAARLALEGWAIAQCAAGLASIALARRLREADVEEEALPPCVLVVPLYLPNEHALAADTLRHAAAQPVSRVHVVYNAPHDMPEAEAALRALAEELATDARPVEVTRVEGSASKAANLNHAVDVAAEPHVLILDADHRVADADACARLRRRLVAHAPRRRPR